MTHEGVLIDRSKVREDHNSVFMSQSPPPAGLPARVAALKLLKDEAAERRKSLPVPRSLAPSNSRKRRRSEGPARPPTRTSGRDLRRHATITVRDEDEISDTDSEPLSDAPSESDTEADMIHAVQAPSVEVFPSPASLASSSKPAASRPNPDAQTRITRPSTRTQPPRNPPARTSARIRVSLAAVPSPPPPVLEADAETEVSFHSASGNTKLTSSSGLV